MASLQQQARALGDPTRHDIFRYVVDASRPVGVAELTTRFDLNHNAVRQHLAKLVEAELIIEETFRSGRPGRPRLQYRSHPQADSRWGVTGPYERLSLVGEIVRSGDEPIEVGRREGRQRPVTREAADPVFELVAEMARQGFEPSVSAEGPTVEVILQRCPFVTAALANPDIVCDLHLGIVQGIAETLGHVVIDELVPRDPRVADCRLRCRV